MTRSHFVILLGVLAASSCLAQAGAGGGGFGSSNWQISVVYNGSDTYVYPVYDANLHAYRLRTDVKDWATNSWTLDGILDFGGPSNASWSTPTSFSGYAESKGTAKVKVKWVGLGNAPVNCYLMLTSSAGAGGQAENPGIYSADDGQGDPMVSATGSSYSTGTHAKRLKLDNNGEATYTVSMNAKAAKTGTLANLVANTGLSHNLDVKAISLFLDTYLRTPEGAGEAGPVIRLPAWTGDVENEKGEFGCWPDPNYAFVLSLGFPVNRIGTWSHPESNFSSGISKGSRDEVGNLNGPIETILTTNIYSNEDCAKMRTEPQIVVLTAKQSDNGSSNSGPFNTKFTMKVWAPERYLGKLDKVREENHYCQLNNGDTYLKVPKGLTGSLTLTTSETGTVSFSVSVVRGISFSVPLELLTLGVKSDTGATLGFSYALTVAVGTSYGVPIDNTRDRFFRLLRHRIFYDCDRYLAFYDSAGYSSDFVDTVQNTRSPEQAHYPVEVNPI